MSLEYLNASALVDLLAGHSLPLLLSVHAAPADLLLFHMEYTPVQKNFHFY